MRGLPGSKAAAHLPNGRSSGSARQATAQFTGREPVASLVLPDGAGVRRCSSTTISARSRNGITRRYFAAAVGYIADSIDRS